jgi:hypothetical protein
MVRALPMRRGSRGAVVSERSYGIRYRVGNELYLHNRRMWASLEVVLAGFAKLFAGKADTREACIVAVDPEDMSPIPDDPAKQADVDYQHAESRMAYWTERCLQLRPDAPLPSMEWRQLTSSDLDELGRASQAWWATQDPDGALANAKPSVKEHLRDRLASILDRAIEKMLAVRTTPRKPREITVEALAKVGITPCGDNSCVFGSPSGMATNGGCRCFARPGGGTYDRVQIGRMANVIRDLAAQLAETRR